MQQQQQQPKQQIKRLSKKRRSNEDERDGPALPGVQKLKAALRQTRRLLAKDNLAADVRVETERRLRSLEADLLAAEQSRKERAMAVKYHKVKFFERRKVMRKIGQVKKELDACGSHDPSSSKKSASQLENALFELRVDLNYTLRYPKLEKYISLFPSSGGSESQSEPSTTSDAAITATHARRTELRNMVREKMETGEFPVSPELELEGILGLAEAVSRTKERLLLAPKTKVPGQVSSSNPRGPEEGDARLPKSKQTKRRESVDNRRQAQSRETDTAAGFGRSEEDDFFESEH